MRRKSVLWNSLIGETIIETKWSNQTTSSINLLEYGCQTLITKSGREFVITQAMGEVQLSEVVK